MAEPLTAEREEAFWAGVENARRGLFMGVADVQRALERLLRILDLELWQTAQTPDRE